MFARRVQMDFIEFLAHMQNFFFSVLGLDHSDSRLFIQLVQWHQKRGAVHGENVLTPMHFSSPKPAKVVSCYHQILQRCTSLDTNIGHTYSIRIVFDRKNDIQPNQEYR